MADVPSAESTVHITISVAKGDMSAAQCLAAWNDARGTDTKVRVTLTPTSPVKIATSAAGAYAATAGAAITIDFAVNALTSGSWEVSGDNFVYTAATQNWYYAVEGAAEVQTGLTAGTVGAGVAMQA